MPIEPVGAVGPSTDERAPAPQRTLTIMLYATPVSRFTCAAALLLCALACLVTTAGAQDIKRGHTQAMPVAHAWHSPTLRATLRMEAPLAVTSSSAAISKLARDHYK